MTILRVIFFSVTISILVFLSVNPSSSALGLFFSPNELIEAVNNLRASEGLTPYLVDDWLMHYAQEHSDYQAATGISTHKHKDGTLPWEIGLQENVAGGDTGSLTVKIVVEMIWSDPGHRKTMTGYPTGFVGAGVAVNGGTAYITLDIRPGDNPATITPGTNTSPAETERPGTEQPFVPLMTSTPLSDGAIVHVVGPGQTLWSIALSYGVKIDDIRGLNDLPADSTDIYVGQKLIIRLPGSVTPATVKTATVTLTPSPTRTHRPSATLTTAATRIPKSTLAPTLTPYPTSASLLPDLPGVDYQNLGLILLAVSGVGILLVLIFGFLRK